MDKEKIIAHADGACSGNPGPGGYGVVLETAAGIEEFSGYVEQTTNQRMELMAAIVALQNCSEGSRVALHSDSAYLIRAWRENWLQKWQKNGWKNSKGEAVANQDLWQKLLQLAAPRQVEWVKVAGHAGDSGNERCDHLAKAAIKNKGLLPAAREFPCLLVLNKDEDTIMYVDIAAKKTIKTIAVDKNPHEVVISPDNRWAYVACSGGNSLLVVDNQSMEVVRKFTHPDLHFPHGLALPAVADKLFLTATRSNRLYILDLPALSIRQVLATGQELVHMVSLDSKDEYGYIANLGSANLSLLDIEKEEIRTHIGVGRGPEGVAVHPQTDEVYVANQHDNDVYVLAAADHQLLATIKVGSLPVRLLISPGGKYAFVSNRESGDLSIIDCRRRREIKRIRLGLWPGGIVFDDKGKFAYVANNKTNDVSVIALESLKEIDRIDVGVHPDGIGFLNRF